MIKPEGRWFNSHPVQSFLLSLCGPNSISRANRGSRVTSRGSRVNGRRSRVEKLFKIIFKLFLNFVNSKVHRLVFTRVSGGTARFPRIWAIFLFVKNFYIPTDSLKC